MKNNTDKFVLYAIVQPNKCNLVKTIDIYS